MRLRSKEIADICNKMNDRGIVVYGAGANGVSAIESLRAEGYRIKAVADKRVGADVMGFTTVSLDDLCNMSANEVCIVTPNTGVSDERNKLKMHYDTVIDNEIITWMKYYLPAASSGFAGAKATNLHPFNHYESPYPCESEVEQIRYDADVLDIPFDRNKQDYMIGNLISFGSEYVSLMERNNTRYVTNSMYSLGDTIVLHYMLRAYKPKNIIEIGSGFSTCVMLDTNQNWLDGEMHIRCIEPYPARLYANLRDGDAERLLVDETYVQNVDLSVFAELKESDVLFIDSSHVAKHGGDVNYELFEILPRLASGVLIHIHDIFWPFQYPLEWIHQGRAYNELYLLRAFLMNNDAYEILCFNHTLFDERGKEIAGKIGAESVTLHGGSIWLRKK